MSTTRRATPSAPDSAPTVELGAPIPLAVAEHVARMAEAREVVAASRNTRNVAVIRRALWRRLGR